MSNTIPPNSRTPDATIPIKDPVASPEHVPQIGLDYTGELQWLQLPQTTGTYVDAYKQLDASRPLLLLPVRIETVYHPRGADNPTELRIRIFPDDLHSDDLDRDLTDAEQRDGQAFWQAWWRAAGDQVRERAAWDGLLAVHGPLRGSWIARSLQPTNELSTWPKTPVAPNAPLVPVPVFPQSKMATRARAGRSRALPTRFCAVGYDGQSSQRFLQFGNPVPASLSTTINPAELVPPVDGKPLVNEKAAWLVDYGLALANGMAITIDLTLAQNAWAKQGVAQLLVFGVNQQHDPAAGVPGVLDELLTAQLYSRGLEVIEPGSPTNNTEDAESSWSARPSDDDQRLTREIRRMLGRDNVQIDGEDAGSLLAWALGVGDAELIHRVPGARRLDSKDAKQMNVALWPTCLGLLLSVLTDGEKSQLLQEGTVDWVSDWCAKYVRGGGPLPTLGVGAQPYGLLPVMWQTKLSVWPDKLSTEQSRRFMLTEMLWRARSWWTGQLWFVPELGIPPGSTRFGAIADVDHDGIDDSLLSILYRQPHPVRFSQRKLRQRKYEGPSPGLSSYGVAGAHVWWLWYIHLAVEGYDDYVGWDAKLGGQGLPTSGLADELQKVRETAAFSSIDRQLDAWRALRTALQQRSEALAKDADRYGRDTAKGKVCGELAVAMASASDSIENPIIALQAHADRHAALRTLSYGIGGVLNEDGPALGYSVFDENTSDVAVPLVEVSNAQGQAIAPRDWLSWLAARCNTLRVATVSGELPPSLATLAAPPLLFTLLRSAMLKARSSAAKLTALNTAIEHLSKLDAATLTRVAAETLGVNSHRYDAWVTSLAMERLGRMRKSAPKGATLGAFGWVLGLTPDRQASDSKGYIHAPSLQQAVTASVLRSGYLAHAQDPKENAAPLAVNLSSARVRLAKWLLDGIRQGQALGDLLGYRLERQLHDQGLDRLIDDLRGAAATVATALGLPKPARTVADGLVLVENRGHPAVQAVLATATGTRTDPGSERARLEAALDSLEAALDATADAVIAQGVHSALIGDDAGGAASFAALAAEQAAPPALEVVKTLRGTSSLTHRLLIAWDPAETKSSWAGAGKHPWSVACTGLESWVASVLGEPSRYVVQANVREEVSGNVLAQESVSVSAAGWSALELVRLAPTGEDEVPLELERRLASVATVARHLKPGRMLEFRWDVALADKLPASDLLLLARSVRQLLQHSQPLAAADLAVAGAEVPEALAIGALRSLVDTQKNMLATAVTKLRAALSGSRASLEAQLKVLASFAVPAAVPAWNASDAEVQASAAVCLQAAERRVAEAQAAAGPSECLQALLGTRLPIPVPFVVPDGPGLTRNFQRGPQRITATLTNGRAAHGVLEGWLQQVGKVHEGAGVLADVLDLGEALADARLTALELAQLPDPADRVEPWVGRAAPAPGEAPRLSLVTWRHAGLRWSNANAGATVAGLRIDQWNEMVPAASQITGVGVHYDAPCSRAPQSILLMVPPETVEWSWDLVVETLRQTIELAKIRGVDNEILGAVGHVLPATFC